MRSYNPNYQDMAVRAAAMGYMEIYHEGRTPPAEGTGTGVEEEESGVDDVAEGDAEPANEAESKADEPEQDEVELEITDKELEDLDNIDLMGLLVGWEDGSAAGSSAGSEDTLRESARHLTLWQLSLIVIWTRNILSSVQPRQLHSGPSARVVRLPPDGIAVLARQVLGRRPVDHLLLLRQETRRISRVSPYVESNVLELLIFLRLPAAHSVQLYPLALTETSAARLALNSASSSLSSTETSLRQAQNSLSDLATKFGPKGEWKKLDGTCVEKNLGEYTYELCFFGGATQKSNKGGGNNSLG